MSTNLVIVAIPEEQDRVWKISSEKVPHLTLLFLGEADTNPHLESIMQFVEHATQLSEHGPFYLEVDHRGTLGQDEADVIFFSERNRNLKWIKQFRGQLLQNEQIRTAFDSTEQFEEWEPHLTLGYPDTPANEPGDGYDHPLYSVCFDRIAVWTGDYSGPDFRLEWPEREFEGDMAVAWSDAKKAEMLHYGIKGMRWGQRKTETVTLNKRGTPKTQLVTPRKAARLDKKWERDTFTPKTWFDIHNAGADRVNSKITEINSSFHKKYPKEMSDGTLFNESHHVTREYTTAYNKEFVAGLNEGAAKLPASPTGKYKVKIISQNEDKISEFGWGFDREAVQHAIEDSELIFVADRDSSGLITKVTPRVEKEVAIAQTATLGEVFLEHYGVKGMRWGQRKSEAGGSGGAGAASKSTAGAKAKSGLKALGRGVGAVAKVAGDVTFENMATDGRAREAIEIDATNALHRTDLPKIKAKPEYQKAKKLPHRLRHPRDPATKQYRKEVKSTYINRLEQAANTRTNPSGTRQYTIRERGWELPAQGGNLPTSRSFWEVSTREVQHADTSKPFFVELITDDDGFITELKPVEPKSAAHSVTDLGEAFIIEHYGIKGMRWGFRRATPTAVSPHATSRIPHGNRRKTKVEVVGGQNHPAHEDAIYVAQAKAKLKKSGTAALSNKELQDVANRVQLEERVKVLTSSKGKRFVQRELQSEGQNLAKAGAKKAAKAGAKKAATAAFA